MMLRWYDQTTPGRVDQTHRRGTEHRTSSNQMNSC
jgi:hypothetical protein